jgi:isopenicillin-N epimerase
MGAYTGLRKESDVRETEPADDGKPFGRREFLGLGAAVAGTALLGSAGCSSDESARVADLGTDLSGWAGVRDLFDLDPKVVHLASFLLAAHPRQVREAIQKHRVGLDANPVEYLHANEASLEQDVRDAAGSYLRASPDEIALTDSTTMGLALMYRGLRLRAGDEVVTTEHDFYATHVSLRAAAARSGATIRSIRLYDDPAEASRERIVAAIDRALTRRTRCLAVTWVHSSTGVKLPLGEIAAVVRAANRNRPERERVLLCVDGVHGFGVEETSPLDLGCDLFATGCHKWLFGPRGTGLLWGRPAAWRRLEPTIPSFDGRAYLAWMNDVSPPTEPAGPVMTPGGFHSFEHRWALAAAFDLHERIGQRRIAERTRSLARRLKEGLAASPRVRLRTPLDGRLSSGLVCFEVRDVPARDAVARLRAEHDLVLSVTPYRTEYVRAGPTIVNTPEEVDRLLDAIRAL